MYQATCCWAPSDSVDFLLVPCWGCTRPLKAFPVLPPSTEIHEGSSCNLTYYSSGSSRDACSLVHLQGIMKLGMLSDLQCCTPRVRCVPAAETCGGCGNGAIQGGGHSRRTQVHGPGVLASCFSKASLGSSIHSRTGLV